MKKFSKKSLAKMYETVADIAFVAGNHHHYSGNSRADMQHFIFLAEKFHDQYRKEITADWEDVGKDYMDEIESFIEKELKPVKKLMMNYPAAFENAWDNIEVAKCRDDGENTFQLDDDDDQQPGDFWSVYAHQQEGGAMCIADFPTEQDANDFADTLRKAVITFKDNGYLEMYTQKHLLDAINEHIAQLKSRSWNDSYSAALSEVKTFVNRIIR